jgi:DNA-binding NtrC family response regulator
MDLPPLRERTGDIETLTEHFVKEANKELNKSVESISETVMNKIISNSWPGNVRELRNAIRRSVLLTSGRVLEQINITDKIGAPKSSYLSFGNDEKNVSFEDVTKNAERDAIMKAIDEADGNKSKAAKLLNMNERTFYRKLKNLGIN